MLRNNLISEYEPCNVLSQCIETEFIEQVKCSVEKNPTNIQCVVIIKSGVCRFDVFRVVTQTLVCLLPVEIFTGVYTGWNSGCILKCISQQPVIIEPCFTILHTFPVSNEPAYLHAKF